MKSRLLFLKRIIILICFFSIGHFIQGNAQQRNLKNELLVYILPDSLEIPSGKTSISYTEAKILSKSLESALAKLKLVAISKALPDWNKADSIKTGKDGIKIKAPQFDRIFTLTFKSEEQANAAMEVLKELPSVLFAEKNSQPSVQNDPSYLNGTQWHLNNDGRNNGVLGADIHAEQAWNIFTGSTAVTIAVFDTGLELTHDELSGKSSGDANLSGTADEYHGTHVAGIAAGNAFNQIGGRGVDWNARLLSKRIFEPSGYIGDADVAQKITDAVNSGAQIANHSWGGSSYSTTLAMAFAYSYKMNSTSVVAMGNNNGTTVQYPAGLNNVIAVGATQNDDQHSPFSNTGNHIDVSAPGGITNSGTDPRDIFSSGLNNGYELHAGTSQAAPQVAGIASLLKGFNTALANDDIENIIEISADDKGVPGWDTEYGHGRVNAAQALGLLQAPNTVNQFTASGGTVAGTSSNYTAVFYATPGLSAGAYVVKRYEVTRAVTFPYSFCNIVGAWGRGVGTAGYSVANPNYGEGFCEVVPGTLTNTSATLRTYVYEVYNILGQSMGFYPTTPSNVTFAYTVLGQANNYSISGPDNFCTSGTYTINLPTGATVSWSVSPSGIASTSPSGNSVTLTKITNGSVTLTATITTSCGNTTISKPVSVGLQTLSVSSYVDRTPQPNNYQYLNATAMQLPGTVPGDYNWYEEVNGIRGAWLASGLQLSNYPIPPCTTVYYQCVATTSCGEAVYRGYAYNTNCGGYAVSNSLVVYPNPASTELNISNTEETGKKDGTPKDGSNPEFQVRLYNEKGNILRSAKNPKGSKGLKLDITEVPNGTYYLHISKGKEVSRKQIIIQH